MKLSHDHEKLYTSEIMAGSHAKVPSHQHINRIQVQVETITHTQHFCA